jgi:hypothetical protein
VPATHMGGHLTGCAGPVAASRPNTGGNIEGA